MHAIKLWALALLLTSCGPMDGETSEVRQFGRGDAINDPVLLETLRTHVNASVRRATELKLQVDRDVRADLELLASYLRLRPQRPVTELLAQVDQAIASERTALTDLKAYLDSQTGDARGEAALRTSLGKLLGQGVYSGILDDSIRQLGTIGGDLAEGALPDPYPRHNALTVTKASQLFLTMAARNQDLSELAVLREQLVLLYPARLPRGVPERLGKASSFVVGRSLFVPNSGYVFGGEAIGGRVRGFDCSAYLSLATVSSIRWSTDVMEFGWREMRGDSFAEDDPDGARRAEMRAHGGLEVVKREYVPVVGREGSAPTVADLQPGDLVVWRYPKHQPTRSGHVAMYIGGDLPRGAEGDFLGLEATRADDKSREGVLLRGFDLDARDAYTFVLRRLSQ